MSDSFRVQQNVKIGNDLINLRADSTEEFTQIAQWAVANAALFVNVQAALTSVPPALAPNVAHTQVQQEPSAFTQLAQQEGFGPPQQSQQTGWGQPQQSPPPQFAQPATAGPTCQHGPMVHRSGNKNGRDWSGWFCPTPKGTPNQCSPQFGK